jgi:alpha-glucosidase (family GH31 glycosyl hydrolase)
MEEKREKEIPLQKFKKVKTTNSLLSLQNNSEKNSHEVISEDIHNQELIFLERQNTNNTNTHKSHTTNSSYNNSNNLENSEIGENLKFNIFFLILVLIIFITNLVYFNAPSQRLDKYIEKNQNFEKNQKNQNFENFYSTNNLLSYYKVSSRFSEENKIKLELSKLPQFNTLNTNTSTYNYKLIEKLNVIFTFSIDSVNIKIFSNEEGEVEVEGDKKNPNHPNHPHSNKFHEILDNNDLLLENKKISDLSESNLGVIIFNFPFNYVIYRKDSLEMNETIFDTRSERDNSLIYTKEVRSLFTKLHKGYFSYGMKNFEKNENFENNFFFNFFPLMLFINPKSLNPHGLILLNPGGENVETELNSENLKIKIFNSKIDFYLIIGKSPKEVIEGFQKILGMPFLPKFETLTNLEENNNNSTKIINSNNNNINSIEILQNLKNEYFLLKKSSPRPMIFSNINTLGGQQYAGVNIISKNSSYEEMKKVLRKSFKSNIYGNPHVMIEVCPGIEKIIFDVGGLGLEDLNFSKNSENSETSLDIDKENNDLYLCMKWVQLSSVFPHVKFPNFLQNFLQNFSENSKKNISPKNSLFIQNLLTSINLKNSLSLYLYSYFLKMSLEGGSLIRPLFLDLVYKNFMKDLIDLDSQFMVGSNLMININYGKNGNFSKNENFPKNSEKNENFPNFSKKSTFFPITHFYDFYSGNLLNPNGAGFYNITLHEDKLNIYLRGGLITPLQNETKKSPINLLLALDANFRATGRILLDDMKSLDSLNKKSFYKMEISAMYSNDNFLIQFHVNSFKFKPVNSEYPYISEITIYGYARISVKKITVIDKESRYEMKRENFVFDDVNDVLRIKNLGIKMEIDTKIIIK